MAEIENNPAIQGAFSSLELQRASRAQRGAEENGEGRVRPGAARGNSNPSNSVNDTASVSDRQRARFAEEQAGLDIEPALQPPPQLETERPLQRETETVNALQRGAQNLTNRANGASRNRPAGEEQAPASGEPALNPPPQLETERPLERETETVSALERGARNLVEGAPEEGAGQGINLPFSRDTVQSSFQELRQRPSGEEEATVARQDSNRGALRPSYLVTNAALRANRDQRSLLGVRETPAPQADNGNADNPLLTRTEFGDTSPPAIPIGSERTENEAPAAAREGRERNEEETPNATANRPENVQTQRGQNIDRLI